VSRLTGVRFRMQGREWSLSRGRRLRFRLLLWPRSILTSCLNKLFSISDLLDTLNQDNLPRILHEFIISDVAIRKIRSIHSSKSPNFYRHEPSPKQRMMWSQRNLYASHLSKYFNSVLFITQLMIDFNFALSVNLVTQSLSDVNSPGTFLLQVEETLPGIERMQWGPNRLRVPRYLEGILESALFNGPKFLSQ
jgi:hypothetical protein